MRSPLTTNSSPDALAPGFRVRRAFTLIEVTVTVTLLAIMGAVAAHTYSSTVGDRQLAAVEAVLGDVTAAQKQLGADFGTYSTWASDLGTVASEASLLAGGSVSRPGEVSMVVGSLGSLGLAAQTEGGQCVVWRVAPVAAGGKQVEVDSEGACSGGAALAEPEVAAQQVAPVR